MSKPAEAFPDISEQILQKRMTNQTQSISTSGLTSVRTLFFKRAPNTQNVKLGYIPEEDFTNTYTDWDLDDEVDEFRKMHPDKVRETVARLDKWFLVHEFETLDLMHRSFGYHAVDYATFKQLLIDLNVPATAFERHFLCMLLDFAMKKCISIRNFEHCLNDLYRIHLEILDRETKFQDLFDENVYIRLNIVNYSYIDSTRFRGHFRELVRHNMNVGALGDLIQARVPMIHRELEYYKTLRAVLTKQNAIPQHLTLEEAGYKGGPFHAPSELFIFYVQILQHPCCPILMYKPYNTVRKERKRIVNQDSHYSRYM